MQSIAPPPRHKPPIDPPPVSPPRPRLRWAPVALAPAGVGAERITQLFGWMAAGALLIWFIVVGLAVYASHVRPAPCACSSSAGGAAADRAPGRVERGGDPLRGAAGAVHRGLPLMRSRPLAPPATARQARPPRWSSGTCPPPRQNWRRASRTGSKHGEKFTGMPAWPAARRDDEVWVVEAAVPRPERLPAPRVRRTGPAPGVRTLPRPRRRGLSAPRRPERDLPARVATGLRRGHPLSAGSRGRSPPPWTRRSCAGWRSHYAEQPASLHSPPAADPAALERGAAIVNRGIPAQGMPAGRPAQSPLPRPRRAAPGLPAPVTHPVPRGPARGHRLRPPHAHHRPAHTPVQPIEIRAHEVGTAEERSRRKLCRSVQNRVGMSVGSYALIRAKLG